MNDLLELHGDAREAFAEIDAGKDGRPFCPRCRAYVDELLDLEDGGEACPACADDDALEPAHQNPAPETR